MIRFQSDSMLIKFHIYKQKTKSCNNKYVGRNLLINQPNNDQTKNNDPPMFQKAFRSLINF